jgi:hypothetical protein
VRQPGGAKACRVQCRSEPSWLKSCKENKNGFLKPRWARNRIENLGGRVPGAGSARPNKAHILRNGIGSKAPGVK